MHPCFLVLLIVLAGCAGTGESSVGHAPAPLPVDSYLAAAERGAEVYRIDQEKSLLLVHVGRAGAARRLGHDHIVASESISGYIETSGDRSDGRADIMFPVADLIVDKADYRLRLGLDLEPTKQDVAGTYRNMMKLLEPELYPWVSVQARVAAVREDGVDLALSVTLHGATAEYLVPAHYTVEGPLLVAQVNAIIRHGDFALEPFSVMGGLLRVADELTVEMNIVARRL